jgi:8-oxo-dGTP pyrophosphatase MutT (NUDIX family)
MVVSELKTDIVLKTLVINSDGKLLLLRRSNTDTRRPLQWDLPGGKMDEGETLEQGAVREVKEEAGIHITDQPMVVFSKAEVASWYDQNGHHGRNVVRIYFAAHVDSSKVTLSYEHDQFVWVTLKDALDKIEYDRHKEVIQYILDNDLAL